MMHHGGGSGHEGGRHRELQRAREEKREKEELQRRIKARLYENKLDRALKYGTRGLVPAAEDGKERRTPLEEGTGSTTAAPSLATTTSDAGSGSTVPPAPAAALLQIRMPTGAVVKHEFLATDTLGNVYEFVSQHTGRDASHFLLLQPGIPKVEFPLETAVTTTLTEAQLVPRGSITVMNKEDKGIVRGLEAEPHMDYRRRRFHYPAYDDSEDEDNADSMSYEQLLELEERIGVVGKGLSKEDISRIPTVTFTKEEEFAGEPTCSICLTDFDSDNVLRKLPCAHAFHKAWAQECIDMWLTSRKTCPVCKQRTDDLALGEKESCGRADQ